MKKQSKKWTVKKWELKVEKNRHIAYGLAVLLQALCLKEFGGDKVYVKGLSGAQYDLAVKLSKLIPDNLYLGQYKGVKNE
jgi:hypothetical protein